MGAWTAALAVLAHFFAVPWHTPAAELTDADKAFILNWAATRLRALGRLIEAADPMQAALNLTQVVTCNIAFSMPQAKIKRKTFNSKPCEVTA